MLETRQSLEGINFSASPASAGTADKLNLVRSKTFSRFHDKYLLGVLKYLLSLCI